MKVEGRSVTSRRDVGEKKSDRTRRRLLEAAIKVVGERGLSDLSVGAINKQAQVSQGTFYLYFKDRWDIVGQLVSDLAETVRLEMDIHHIGDEDPAERIAYAVQWLIRYNVRNPDMGWVNVRMTEYNTLQTRQMRRRVGKSLIDILEDGRARGRFLIELDEFMLDGLRAIYGGAVREMLNGETDRAIPIRATELILRMLGISESEARDLCRRSAPLVSKSLRRHPL